MPVVSMSKNYL